MHRNMTEHPVQNATTWKMEGCKNTISRGSNTKIYAEENSKESVK